MKEIKVSVNTWYVVEGTAGATVINPSTNKAIATVEDGKQTAFYATTPYVLVSDDSVNIFKATFNSAPAKLKLLGLLGGGASTGSALPAGYLAAQWLQDVGGQYIDTGIKPTPDTGIYIDFETDYSHPETAPTPVGVRYAEGVAWYPPRFSKAWLYTYYTNGGATVYGNISASEVPDRAVSMMNFNGDGIVSLKSATRTFINNSLSRFEFVSNYTLYLFTFNRENIITASFDLCGKIHECIITEKSEIIADYKAAIDAHGVPCYYEKVSKKTLYNAGTGAFVVGMNIAQARKLGKLPAGGGTLRVSLPSNWQEDEGVLNARAEAEAKGWKITVQTYAAEAGATATFALRRIWVRKTQDEYGSYVAADGSRWRVDWCVDVWGADPQELGYEPYRSVDAAVAYWELSPWVDPEAETFLTE